MHDWFEENEKRKQIEDKKKENEHKVNIRVVVVNERVFCFKKLLVVMFLVSCIQEFDVSVIVQRSILCWDVLFL